MYCQQFFFLPTFCTQHLLVHSTLVITFHHPSGRWVTSTQLTTWWIQMCNPGGRPSCSQPHKKVYTLQGIIRPLKVVLGIQQNIPFWQWKNTMIKKYPASKSKCLYSKTIDKGSQVSANLKPQRNVWFTQAFTNTRYVKEPSHAWCCCWHYWCDSV